MGIFDKLFKKKRVTVEGKEVMGLEKKGTRLVRINRVEVVFNATSKTELPSSEQVIINDLIDYFGLADRLTTGVRITTLYGHVPGVAESLNTGEISDELMATVIARAMISGMIRDPKKDLEKIRIYPFKVLSTYGVLITKEV